MNKKDGFNQKVLEKYPDAIIYTDDKGYSMAGIKNESGSAQILGCCLCFDNRDVRLIKDTVMIQDQEAIPLTAISEDDSMNPVISYLFLCPICSRIIVHPQIA